MTDVGLYILEMFNEWKAGWMNGLIDGWKFLIFFFGGNIFFTTRCWQLNQQK